MIKKNIKLSTRPYKGTRDFFPDEMRLRKKIFSMLTDTLELFGYEPYDGPLIESFDIYAAKTGEEIVNEQLYTFNDRSERKVAIRPEMTPTLARMVAQRARDLAKPIRWYALPNLWRYENPQRGRLREHWQLNVDIFGINGSEAEIEIMTIAIDLLLKLGATGEMFELRLNHRRLMDDLLKNILKLQGDALGKTVKLIDKKNKLKPGEFQNLLKEAGLREEQADDLLNFFSLTFDKIPQKFPQLTDSHSELSLILDSLSQMGYGKYIKFSPEIMRGFDYYTGVVFEVFDKNPENRRSLYGGGRYDNLVELFGASPLSGVGFGMGDVTLFDFLKTHNLLPDMKKSNIVMIALFPEEEQAQVWKLSKELRQKGIAVDIPWGISKLGKQFRAAEKKGINVVLIQGSDERKEKTIQVKILDKGSQDRVPETELVSFLEKILF